MKPVGCMAAVVIAVFVMTLSTNVSSSASAPVSQSETLQPATSGSITYLSGGVGDSEAAMMRGLAKDYLLEIVFIQKLKQREEFLADVKVRIQDNHLDLLLDIATDGPYLLANLPQGKYLVVAEYKGVVKQQWVRVGNTKHQIIKHQKVVFWWPISGSPQNICIRMP